MNFHFWVNYLSFGANAENVGLSLFCNTSHSLSPQCFLFTRLWNINNKVLSNKDKVLQKKEDTKLRTQRATYGIHPIFLHVCKAPVGDQSVMTVKQSRTHRMCVLSKSCFGLSDTEYTITPSHTYIKPHPITSERRWMNYAPVRILLRMRIDCNNRDPKPLLHQIRCDGGSIWKGDMGVNAKGRSGGVRVLKL